ncbi:cytochrome b/b6 domain-containing protein [Temperatibacter marinus]|uniref:Cytochrome b/b6 domain-containing protein n=1 Tax=Temperatibacter marinus TaxID=1456591 RepID=A0AA52EFE1_9PROT|nr:cytochrome b/b6 domain-containing protein [Temperatibacter marinus]WND03781.1 cytochrome b/b6 domain-containing protein [Temperatibacter marinus]
MQGKVWDLATRLFHWLLVIAFAVACYSGFQDKIVGNYGDIHRRAGIFILILVLFRFIWGVVGSDTSRFSRFVKGPRSILHYVRGESQDSGDSIGHSPLGALSVMAMLVLLLTQATLGLFGTDGILFEGPLAHLVDNSERITLIHRWIGYSLMGLVGLHLAAILFYKLVKKKALVWPMISGNAEVQGTPPIMRSQWRAITVFFVSGGLVCSVIFIWLQ